MKLRTLFICLLACLPLTAMKAGDNDDVKKKLNSIKKSMFYLYGEATAETEEEAHALAEEILYEEINSWAAQKRKLKNSTNLVVNNIQSLCNTISIPRGNMIRSFIYVKKSDISPATDDATIISNSSPNSSVSSKDEDTSSTANTVEMNLPSCIKALNGQTDYYKVTEEIKAMKAAGKIKSYARYAQLDDPKAYYLVIYNRAAKVVAILTPGEERRNVATGKIDAVSNYSGHGAIGIEVNK